MEQVKNMKKIKTLVRFIYQETETIEATPLKLIKTCFNERIQFIA